MRVCVFLLRFDAGDGVAVRGEKGGRGSGGLRMLMLMFLGFVSFVVAVKVKFLK